MKREETTMIKRLLIISLIYFCFQDSANAACLPGWSYNRSITVTNSNAAAYTNFQVKLTVNTQALIAAGKMRSNGEDIRFTDANCNNLHYWIDSNINTTTTVIWVKVNTLAASTSKTIYMYYGNYCATPAQNGDSTFVLFDDFNGSTINASKWNTYQQTPGFCSITVAGGTATFATTTGSDNVVRSVSAFPGPLRIEGKLKANTGGFPSIAILNSGTFTGVSMYTGDAAFSDQFHLNTAGASCVSFASSGNSSGVTRANGVWGLAWAATNSANSYFPGGTQAITATNPMGANQHGSLGLLCTSLGTATYDWARLRKYAPVEIGTTLNAESNQGITINVSPTSICPGAALSVSITKNGVYFNSGNVFKVELSDVSGNFGSPILLGTKTDTIPGNFLSDIPKSLTPGSGYKVRLTSTNPASTCYVAAPSITVHPKPTLSYTFPNDSQCYKWSRYNFTATASVSGGTIDSFIWNWDDGSKIDTGVSNTISHKFKFFYPYYYPKLTVVSNLGCKDSISERVNILESPVVLAEFNDTIQCFRGNFFIVKTRTDPKYGLIVSNNWNMGDGSPAKNDIDSFSHKFANSGTYNIRQINEHSNGCIDTGFLSALVNVHPKAKINTNDTDQCLTGNAFVFQSQSTITNGLPLLNSWNLGGGVTKNLQDSAHHTYLTAGNRTINLITTSDDGFDGCSDTAKQLILVSPMPKAIISNLLPDKCFNYNKFTFVGKSTISTGTVSHNWNFGDLGTLNNSDTARHSYAAPGNFTIKLTTVSNKGCIDSASSPVVVRPSPVPAFTIVKDTQCFKYHQFKVFSTSTIASGTFTRVWNLSDAANYTDVDTIWHKFSGEGKYQIQLILKSNFNCADTVFDSVVVLPMPVSSFIVDDADQCFEGNLFTYTDNSFFTNHTITGNKWVYGDGGTATNQSPVSRSYGAEGAYIPGLIVYGDNGCFDTSFQNIKVYPHPGSDFIINDTGQCINNNNFGFLNNTFISEGSFTNRWFFGDGSAYVDGINASKRYTKDSTYKVTIISFSDQGCTDTASHTLTVFPKSKTNFTIDKDIQCRLGNLFTYTSTTTLKKGTYTLAWNLGDGNLAGNQTVVQKSYTGVQSYNVRLISLTNEGCYDTLIKKVSTLPMPVASYTFNYDKKCLKGNDFQFNATSTPGSIPQTHRWYFGDNDSATSTFTQHTYKTYGPFTVTLISSTNNGNCKDTTTKVMTVFPMPVSSFTIDDDKQCLLNNSFNFTSTATVPTGTIATTSWLFGDNTSSSSATPAKSYIKVDSFRVSLTVITDNGCLDSTFKKVYVHPMPTADFSVSPAKSCFDNNLFKITPKSKITNGFISQYQYYYGNGDSSVIPSPLDYHYPLSGDYIISLRVTTDKGCWDTISRPVSVNPNPVLDFSVLPVCLKDSSYFINLSTIPGGGSIIKWEWKFGNGKKSTEESPVHKYKAVGQYDISLLAVTDKGCSATLDKTGFAIVNANPKAKFEYYKLRSWENEVDIQFIDSSSSDVTSWNWNFGTMGTSTDQNPKLFYVDTLTQPTTLIVTNNNGCKDTVFKLLFITPDVIYYMPSAFTPNDDNINETFKPRGLAYALNYKFIIFNRWGEMLFKTDNPQLGWDGKYEGAPVEQGLYFYRLEFVGSDELRHEEQGNVMILR